MEQKMYNVTIQGETKQYPEGISYGDIVKEYKGTTEAPVILVMADGRLRELHKHLKSDCEIQFVTTKDPIGHKTYCRSATMILLKAIYDVAGQENIDKVVIHYSIGDGYYFTMKGPMELTQDFIDRVKAQMHKIVDANLPIVKRSVSTSEAVALFHKHHMYDKELLFNYRRGSKVNLYSIESFEDYFYGFMANHTGFIKTFDLFLYEGGFVLQLPTQKEPDKVPEFKPREKVFHVQKESQEWGDKLDIATVGELNEKVTRGGIQDILLIQEAMQEAKISEIAARIASEGNKKFVMIAGPSSSGKTTFSHRLSIQLAAHGMKPHPIAVDNYFVDRHLTPVDEFGEKNFECLEAIDVKQFNDDMCRLLAGERVELPSFNFKTGKREYKGNFKQLGPDDILVIEGIHGLNEKTSYALPEESKYKIYISALTNINIDEHNRIPTTDGRLLRRMVRDARTRGADARRTIDMWASVRRGEEQNIFPFQEDADAMFNSVLIYELAILKQYAEPLLFSVREDQPEYETAKYLIKFLGYFLGSSSENVPQNSILREFIGGSCFNVG